MPGASSIYWNSVGSHRSSESSGRQYVDPWDLENYAYLRRHSVASKPPPPLLHPSRRHSNSYSRISYRKSQPEPEYWYAPSSRVEPGYTTPASVEELYFGSPRRLSHYQDVPLYQPLSELDYQRFEDLRIKEVVEPKRRKLSRAKVTASDLVKKREAIYYHSTSSNIRRDDFTVDNNNNNNNNVTLKKKEGKKKDNDCYVKVIVPPTAASKFKFNTRHGHLKIDYTSSWNSLHRKIISK